MGLFGSILKTVVDAVTLPVDAAKDVITMGGACTDNKSATASKLRKLDTDLKDISNDAGKL